MKGYFREEINIDSSARNIFGKIYTGNYIGFNQIKDMYEYSSIDFHFLYFTFFPNLASFVFCILGIVFLFICLFVYLFFLFDKNNCCGCCCWDECEFFHEIFFFLLMIPYIMFHLGYFIYILYAYVNIYKNDNKPSDLEKIRADPFIEDFLGEIRDRHSEENLMVALLIIIIILFPLFILSVVFFVCCCSRVNSDDIQNVDNNKKDFLV